MWHGAQKEVHILRSSQRSLTTNIYEQCKIYKKHNIKNGNWTSEADLCNDSTIQWIELKNCEIKKNYGIRVSMRTSCWIILNTLSTGICIYWIPFIVHRSIKKIKLKMQFIWTCVYSYYPLIRNCHSERIQTQNLRTRTWVKVKITFTPEQATKAQRRRRSTDLLFLKPQR